MSAQEIEFPIFHDSLDGIAPPCASTELVGHKEAVAQIFSATKNGHHALILDGEQGTGKATAAFHVTNNLLAADTAGSMPVDEHSDTYRQIAQNAHPNLLYLTRPIKDDGKGFKTVITVDEVRRLQRFLGMTSSAGDRRIIIVDCLGDLNKNAANAMLKLLEEPPKNTLFLLISHGMGGLLPTIRSRCQLVRFSSMADNEVADILKMVANTILDENEITQLASTGGGSVRDALLMARSGGLELQERFEAFLSSPIFDTAVAHKLAEVAGARGNDTHNLLLRQMMFSSIRRHALEATQRGDINRAEQLARFDGQLSEKVRIADGFNLDRKQEFLVTASHIHALMHAPVNR